MWFASGLWCKSKFIVPYSRFISCSGSFMKPVCPAKWYIFLWQLLVLLSSFLSLFIPFTTSPILSTSFLLTQWILERKIRKWKLSFFQAKFLASKIPVAFHLYLFWPLFLPCFKMNLSVLFPLTSFSISWDQGVIFVFQTQKRKSYTVLVN